MEGRNGRHPQAEEGVAGAEAPLNGHAWFCRSRNGCLPLRAGVQATGGQQLDSIKRKIAGIVTAIEEGDYSRALGDRLGVLEKQQEFLEARLSEAQPSIVRLHPRLAEVYAEKIQQLEQALNDPAIKAEAADALRLLIDRIELSPEGEGQRVAATLHGDLAQILALGADSGRKQKLPKAAASGSQLSVVAGACNHREFTLPPISI
jgi:site-specific DNA recombinase